MQQAWRLQMLQLIKMQTHDKVSLKEKIGYGLGDAASSMFWKIFGMYLMFFLY